MQTPTGSTGQHVQMVDWNMWAGALADLASWWADAFGQQNVVVPGGGTLSAQAGTPIVVNYAPFTAYVNGPARMARFTPGSGSVTLAAADTTYARYDLIVATASQTTPNDSAGNATALDVLTVTKVTGTPANPPLLPALPAYSVQLGTVLVPANATSASTCTITQATGPLSPNNLQDLTNHIAASLANAVVHGFRATAPGGPGANMLAQTDANGAVGRANTVWDGVAGLSAYGPGVGGPNGLASYDVNAMVWGANGLWDGTARRSIGPFNDGSHVGGEIPQYNSNGRVEDSERLQGLVTGTGSGNIPVLDGNGAVAKAEQLVTNNVPFNVASGVLALAWSAANGCTWTLTYPVGVFGGRTPTPTFSIYDPGSSLSTYDSGISGYSATGFSGKVGAAAQGNTDHTIYLLWQAIG